MNHSMTLAANTNKIQSIVRPAVLQLHDVMRVNIGPAFTTPALTNER
jgi:hypothetical protein